jgi:hypothetical protein
MYLTKKAYIDLTGPSILDPHVLQHIKLKSVHSTNLANKSKKSPGTTPLDQIFQKTVFSLKLKRLRGQLWRLLNGLHLFPARLHPIERILRRVTVEVEASRPLQCSGPDLDHNPAVKPYGCFCPLARKTQGAGGGACDTVILAKGFLLTILDNG